MSETLRTEGAHFRRLAELYEADGCPAMATIMRNAAWLAEGGDMEAFEWERRRAAAGKENETDDSEVRP